MSRPQDAIVKLSRGESVEVAQKDGESASGEALPEGWAVAPFGDLFDFKGGSQPPKKEFHNEPDEGLIRLLQIRDFASDKYPVYIKNADKWPKCDKDDIMIARYGASLGRVLTGMAGAYNVALIRMIFDKENLDTDWVRYFLMSDHFQEPIHLLSRSAQNGFNKTEVSPIPVELPPKAEQSRIVSAIESLQERSSRARVLLSEVGPLIGQLRQSVLRDAFSGKLTADWRARRRMGTPESPSPPAPSEENSGLGAPVNNSGTNPAQETASELLLRIRTERRERWQSEQLAKYEAKGKQPPKNWQDKYKEPEPVDESELPELPDGWCWASLDELLRESLANGKSVRDGTGFPVLRLTALQNRQIELSEHKLGDWGKTDPSRFFVEGNDFLLSRGNGSLDLVGRGGIVQATPQDPIAFPDTLIRVRLNHAVDINFFAMLWDSPIIRDQITSAAKTTAGIYKISQSDLEAFAVPLVPIREQSVISELLGNVLATSEALESGLASMESSLTQLDQSILSKAFRGELVPQDPRDEPAWELLARIRTTREDQEAAKHAAHKKTKVKTKKSKSTG